MKYAYIAVIALFTASIPSAFAESDRLTDAQYLTASRCVAYAELSQLSADTFDYASLKSAVDSQRVDPLIRDRARESRRDAVLAGQRAGDNAVAVADLRTRRDGACASFVSSGLVRAGTPTPAA
jgi:hypothetical protein